MKQRNKINNRWNDHKLKAMKKSNKLKDDIIDNTKGWMSCKSDFVRILKS